MKGNAAKFMGVAAAVGILLLAGLLFSVSRERRTTEFAAEEGGQQIVARPSEAGLEVAEQTPQEGHAGLSPAPPQESQRTAGDPVEFEEWAAESLRSLLGREVVKNGHHASLLEFREYLQENYPEDWDTKLRNILERAFPDRADQILTLFGKLDLYDEWFEENKLDLAGMRSEEIEEALWEKRREVFGEDAAEIWDSESRTQHIRDLTEILDEAYDVPLEEKLEVFSSAVDAACEDGAGALAQERRYVMALAFLKLESVQNELAQMSSDERAEGLRQIRRSVGIAEEQIEAMEKLDEEREERWQNGLQYIAERDIIAEDYEGAALEEQLRLLREHYFGDEARIIEAEEASGFFRYRRRRVYGRN